MTNRSKGNEAEKRAVQELEAAGYKVERARPDLRWIPRNKAPPFLRKMGGGKYVPLSKAHDFFGLFDIIAFYSGEGDIKDEVLLLQVTAKTSSSERKHAIEDSALVFPEFCVLEVWRWKGGRATKAQRVPRGWLKERLIWMDETPAWEDVSDE